MVFCGHMNSSTVRYGWTGGIDVGMGMGGKMDDGLWMVDGEW